VITTHPDLASRMLRDADETIIGFDFINDPVSCLFAQSISSIENFKLWVKRRL
jgi:aryl-phospho-beta-D-glucosidase BglC (GH1 family)